MIKKHPKLVTVKILIENGSVDSFTDMFGNTRLSIHVLAEAMGKSHEYVNRLYKKPAQIKLLDVLNIAHALDIDDGVALKLAWADIRPKNKPPR